MLCHLFIVQVGKRKVGVAGQSGFWQMDNDSIAAVTVDCVRPQLRHV